ncbi:MAG TPA: hypothetical protein VEQ10_16785 [Vicinamibacteria bacterium]|nr:hypothetical protein [Vicinamibacteria bacterium]
MAALSATAWLAALLAVWRGALSPAVGVAALCGGLVIGALSARAAAPAAGRHDRWTAAERLAVAAFAAATVRQFGWLLFERGGVLLTLLPYNYGDLPLHWTYVHHISAGAAFWPENPVFTGDRLRYPLGVDLLTALVVQLGPAIPTVLPLAGLLGGALTALALRRWGGALAVAGFLCAGGLAGLQVLWTGRLTDYQSHVDWKSLFLALFVPQRGFLLALPVGLLLLWSWRQRLLRGEGGLAPWVEGLLWGTLPLVHLHSFLFVSLLAAVWALGGHRWRALRPSLGIALLPATWAVWEVTDGFRAASLVGWSPGWTMQNAQPVWFLLQNFGLYLPLALAALAVAARRRRREELLVLLPALAVFALLFVVRLAPWAWDNTKVMLWCYVASLAAIETTVLSQLTPPWRALVVALLFFSGAESVVAASAGRIPRLDVVEVAEYEAVCAAVRPLGRDERVATAQVHNHPVALCGQPLVAGYAGHLWSYGLDARAVEEGLGRLMRGEGDYRAQARALGARYVFWGPREQVAFAGSTRPWEAAGPPLASGSWGALYRLD